VKKHGGRRWNMRSLNLGLPLRSTATISPSRTVLAGRCAAICLASSAYDAKEWPLRETSSGRRSITARARNQSYFSSKTKFGSSNGRLPLLERHWLECHELRISKFAAAPAFRNWTLRRLGDLGLAQLPVCAFGALLNRNEFSSRTLDRSWRSFAARSGSSRTRR
jgi:hypothetical protein